MAVALRRDTDCQQVPSDPLCGVPFHNAVVTVFFGSAKWISGVVGVS